MTHPKGLFGPAAFYVAGDALSNVIPLLLLPVMTRVLSPQDYGIVAMFSVIQLFVQPLIGVSLKDAIGVRFFTRTAAEFAPFVAACCMIVLTSALCVAVASAPFRQLLATVTQVPAGWLTVAIPAAAAQCLIFIRLAVWQMQGRAASFGLFQLAMTVVNVGLSIFLVVGLSLAWQGRLIGYFAALLLFASIAAITLRRAGALAWPQRAEDVRDGLVFALPLVPHGLGVVAIMVADRMLITNMINVRETGLYTAALQISMVIGLVGLAINRAYRPWLFAGLGRRAPGFASALFVAPIFMPSCSRRWPLPSRSPPLISFGSFWERIFGPPLRSSPILPAATRAPRCTTSSPTTLSCRSK